MLTWDEVIITLVIHLHNCTAVLANHKYSLGMTFGISVHQTKTI